MHGVSVDSNNDDIDEMGICIEPPQNVIGLAPFEQYEYRTKAVNERSGAGDIDRTIYSLRKWARLAAAGNPTVLMPLFVPAETYADGSGRKGLVRFINEYGVDLRRNKDMFITKQAGHKFLGYLDGQRQRYLDPNRQDSKHASRPELIDKFGWDTKTGYHALRLAIQGIQLMRYHEIVLPMRADIHVGFLLSVRNGKYTKEQVTTMLDEVYIPKLKSSIENSTLPEKPDMGRINDWLVKAYQSFWKDMA